MSKWHRPQKERFCEKADNRKNGEHDWGSIKRSRVFIQVSKRWFKCLLSSFVDDMKPRDLCGIKHAHSLVCQSQWCFQTQSDPEYLGIQRLPENWAPAVPGRPRTPLDHQHLVAILDAVQRRPEHSIQVFVWKKAGFDKICEWKNIRDPRPYVREKNRGFLIFLVEILWHFPDSGRSVVLCVNQVIFGCSSTGEKVIFLEIIKNQNNKIASLKYQIKQIERN